MGNRAVYHNPQYHASLEAFRAQQEASRKELQATLDACYERVSRRNSEEIARMERIVGKVNGFCGVISRF